MRFRSNYLIALPVLALLSAYPGSAAAKNISDVQELKQSVEQLKSNPGNRELREKIIKMAGRMKRTPALPEEAERNMARGAAFAQKASDAAGYKRAIAEFEAATNEAPWLGLAYYNLGVVQERAGMFTDATRNLKLYLIAEPDAKNAREVKNKIYALEAESEAVQAGMTSPAHESAPQNPPQKLAVAAAPALEIVPDKELRIIKLSADKKATMPNFAGNWFFKETINGEERIYQAFEIAKTAAGDLNLVPPQRLADSIATVQAFEIRDRRLRLQMKWRIKSSPGYWKTETYELTLSPDGTRLSGSHSIRAINNYNRDMDRILFRQ